MNDEGGSRIGEQGEAEPLEYRDIARIAHENFQQDGTQAERRDVKKGRPADQKLDPGPHGADIGAEIEDIGHQHQPDQRIEQWPRIIPAQIAGNAQSGDAADARADLLDPCHQGIGEQQRPGEPIAELRAGLGIRGNPAGIVVGGAGDQTWTQDLRQGRAIAGGDRLVAFDGHRNPAPACPAIEPAGN